MFGFLQKAIPAAEVAKELWKIVSDGSMTRSLADSASELSHSSHSAALDEAVYFLSFATDLTIHRVFNGDVAREQALRTAFQQHLRDYAIRRHCTPCPVGDWRSADSNAWQIHSAGYDHANPLLHVLERFDLYTAAMRRPANPMQPVVGILCALCGTRDVLFDMQATSFFTDYSVATQDFLRKIRIKP